MNQADHYTEEDLQNYIQGSFEGDAKAVEAHLQVCERCNESYKAYSSVWNFMMNDLQVENLKIDLVRSVADRAFKPKKKSSAMETTLYGSIVSLIIALLFLCLKSLLASSVPVPFLLFLFPAALFLWINFKEIRMVQEKYNL